MIESVSSQKIPCADIRRFEEQPRKHICPKKIESLARSIKEIEQRKPIQVKVLPVGTKPPYELIDGERRWRACALLGIPVMAIVRNDVTEIKYQFLESVLANDQDRLTHLERMEAIWRIKKDFDVSLEKVSVLINKSFGWVLQHAALSKLDPEVQDMMSEERPPKERLKYSNAILLPKLSPEKQIYFAKLFIAERLPKEDAINLLKKTGNYYGKAQDELAKYRFALSQVVVRSDSLFKQRNSAKGFLTRGSQVEVQKYLDKMDRAAKNLAGAREVLERVWQSMQKESKSA